MPEELRVGWHGPRVAEGKRVRVRGWIDERNGPAMDLTHPEQVELLR